MTALAFRKPARCETAAEALAWGVAELRGSGVPTPALDAKLLLMHVLGIDREAIVRDPDMAVDAARHAQFTALIRRRAAREPVARLTGRSEFWSLPLSLSADMLVPRPDSETVIECALEGLGPRDDGYRILDLGTGSGCLLLALLSELPQAWGIGIDRSYNALIGAAENARRLGLHRRASFLCTDWMTSLVGPFDIVVANPPYIPTHDIDGLEPEVSRHDPRAALDGGPDGLDAYRAIGPALPRIMAKGGRAVLEVGATQAAAVSRLMQVHGLRVRAVASDLGGNRRCVKLEAA